MLIENINIIKENQSEDKARDRIFAEEGLSQKILWAANLEKDELTNLDALAIELVVKMVARIRKFHEISIENLEECTFHFKLEEKLSELEINIIGQYVKKFYLIYTKSSQKFMKEYAPKLSWKILDYTYQKTGEVDKIALTRFDLSFEKKKEKVKVKKI